MKPRGRPGKAATGGKFNRSAWEHAKPLSANQIERLKKEREQRVSRAGRGGKRASWDIDYEEGMKYAARKMPNRENDAFSWEGVRRLPKRGRKS